MTTCPKLHAVIAGDVVDSSKLSTERRRGLAPQITAIHRDVADAFGGDLPHDIATVAGDEWRMYVDRPRSALAAALALCTKLRAEDIISRVIVVIDEVDFIEEGDLQNSDGPAFRRAGRGLDALSKRERRFDLLLPDSVDRRATLFAEMTGELVDVLLDDLTAAQARSVAEMIRGVAAGAPPTTSEIAGRWEPDPISRQAVGKHLHRARWDVFERTLDRFTNMMKTLDDDDA
ncbi:MAG: hypothetical protein ACOCV2_15435 [Persicimonas sp.]